MNQTPQIKTTKVYKLLEQDYKSNSKISCFQGSSRASKTYNILIWIAVQMLSGRFEGKTIAVVRSTLPALKATAERDFFEILDNLGLYSESNHNKTERQYYLGNAMIEFFSCDNEMKVRGRKRDILFINEANELDYQIYQQLALRTSELIILDYNPSDEFHWIYDYVVTRNDCSFHKVTYKDNPFLPDSIVREIENLQFVDYNLWRVFGLGERGASMSLVYPTYELCDAIPENSDIIHGLDFGFNNPMGLVRVGIKDKCTYSKQLLYQTHLTTNDLITLLPSLGVGKQSPLYCDSAEPDRIKELQRAGYYAIPAKKDVEAGITFVKSMKQYITKDSTDLIKEQKMYKYKQDSTGKVFDEVVKLHDHLQDARRYAIFTHLSNHTTTNHTVTKKLKSPYASL